MAKLFLGIDCGSVSLNLFLLTDGFAEPLTVYLRTRGRPLQAFIQGVGHLLATTGGDTPIAGALVTGSARELLSGALNIPAINEISAHAVGAHAVNPEIRTIIEIGGQDSKYIRIEPSSGNEIPRIPVFRMNEICAAGTGSFLDEQAERLGIGVDSFGPIALQSTTPAPIAGRCAVFAKTDMIHQAQEGRPLPDILLGLAAALVRNYIATLMKGDAPEPVVSLQGGVMSNRAVVHAFRKALGLSPGQLVVPTHFRVLGALGSAKLAAGRQFGCGTSLGQLRKLAEEAMKEPLPLTSCQPITRAGIERTQIRAEVRCDEPLPGPLVLGLDVGSVSVKGVIVDASGRLVREDYRLSRSRPLEAVTEVLSLLLKGGVLPDVIAVTGSGRYLAGRLLDSDLIVNEITAQSRAALDYDNTADTVVEIGGQDSKWIAFEGGHVSDFEMNRVCAAGTGSFLMAQAQRLDLPMGEDFSQAAFASRAPADLGTRCTVFMESDLIHHQNNGAASEDLAAGVCVSIVRNYLERVANHKGLGKRVLFLGGVAATPAVKAAFEQQTGREFHVPSFFRVSGAFGAALNALDKVRTGELSHRKRTEIQWNPEAIQKDQFSCRACSNQCRINRYKTGDRVVFHGGLCDRWESEERTRNKGPEANLFSFRTEYLDKVYQSGAETGVRWAMIRSPQFYDYFPFWNTFLNSLGISLILPSRPDRAQFEAGARYMRVETCLPVKVMAGQIRDAVHSGARSLFHPSVLSEPSTQAGEKPLVYCPYIQASSQFFRGVFDVEWIEPTINSEIDPDAFRREHLRFGASLGFPRRDVAAAFERACESLEAYRAEMKRHGERFLNSLGDDEKALVVLGKPYHTADVFLNMNLGSLFQRLGMRALPSDFYPIETGSRYSINWKYQAHMVRVAGEISRDPRLFPIFINFFGCGQDAFTLRHLRDILTPKPLLVLEMDEHTSRAGLITRIEAFLERVRQEPGKPETRRVAEIADAMSPVPASAKSHESSETRTSRRPKPQTLYLPYLGDHAYAFAAAARSVGVEAHVLPPPDPESEALGQPHVVGGECHPYALVLGDYLKLANNMREDLVEQSRFYMLSPNACRLAQFPVYIEKVRSRLGLSLGIIHDTAQGLKEFGISPRSRQSILLRVWEGLNAYDVLFRLFLQIRARTKDEPALDRVYTECRRKLYDGLSSGRVRQTVEEVLQDLYMLPVPDAEPRPVIAVTGDYYTRVVSFANNNVYREVEALGGCLWSPPTFSDCFKLGTLRDFTWSLLSGRSRDAARHGLFYTIMTLLELNVKSSRSARQVMNGPLDVMGLAMWRTATHHAHTKLPAGITAPIATTLKDLDSGADGILNLITLNCSYGTVVTAALMRVLKTRPETPMLTLVYDGQKKTNEKTRIEAFMEQVHDRFRSKMNGADYVSGSTVWRKLMPL
ncbi:MAG TPA: acyl-CoA dehydratase activase [Desulfomonilaceae bacterium]|nr:acyl-CoA dehydratase activase [Desulfomonilaceae bacterium]